MLTIPVVGDSDYKHSRISLFVVFIFLQKDFKPNWTRWLEVERLAKEDLRDLAIKRHCTQWGQSYSSHQLSDPPTWLRKANQNAFFPNFVTLWTFVLMLSSVRGDCQSINDTFSLGPFLFKATRYNKPANAHTLAGTSWRINSRQECL